VPAAPPRSSAPAFPARADHASGGPPAHTGVALARRSARADRARQRGPGGDQTLMLLLLPPEEVVVLDGTAEARQRASRPGDRGLGAGGDRQVRHARPPIPGRPARAPFTVTCSIAPATRSGRACCSSQPSGRSSMEQVWKPLLANSGKSPPFGREADRGGSGCFAGIRDQRRSAAGGQRVLLSCGLLVRILPGATRPACSSGNGLDRRVSCARDAVKVRAVQTPVQTSRRRSRSSCGVRGQRPIARVRLRSIRLSGGGRSNLRGPHQGPLLC
jgi:hypothetical protein